MTQRIKEKIDSENTDLKQSNEVSKTSDKLESAFNHNFIEGVAKENLKQIQSTNHILAKLDKNELSVLYSVWSLENINKNISIDNLVKDCELTKTEVESSLKSLKDLNLIIQDGGISSNYKKVLDSFFNIDEYSGMRYVEKINALIELINRIPKIM